MFEQIQNVTEATFDLQFDKLTVQNIFHHI